MMISGTGLNKVGTEHTDHIMAWTEHTVTDVSQDRQFANATTEIRFCTLESTGSLTASYFRHVEFYSEIR